MKRLIVTFVVLTLCMLTYGATALRNSGTTIIRGTVTSGPLTGIKLIGRGSEQVNTSQ